jgi:kynurenine formamidase
MVCAYERKDRKMTERRACFDFEMSFSNGGGMQGQGFRIDISGDEIADDALAASLIADMRLLMVGSVRILNKKVIEEAHKRSTASLATSSAMAGQIHVDLSHVIEDGMITYKGLPAPVVCDHLSFTASHAHYDEGTEFNIGRIDMVANTGTYIDTPYHRYRDGYDLSGLPLGSSSGLPGLLVRVTGAVDRVIDWHSFAAADVRGRAVLVHTGWDAHWRTDRYFEGHPFLTEAAARHLADRGAVLVGIDSLNIDDTSGGARPVHSVLLGAGIPIVEHLTNLSALPESDFRFVAVPPKIRGLGTFPVRAHAVLDSGESSAASTTATMRRNPARPGRAPSTAG